MSRFAVASKALRGPFRKLVRTLELKLRRVLVKKGGFSRSSRRDIAGRAEDMSADEVERNLDDLSSLRGATPEEIRRLVPEGWVEKPLKKGDGVRFLNPRRPGEFIGLEMGTPRHEDPLHSGPYIKVSKNGLTHRIPMQGNPTLGES
jgi:hypothetical protein